MRLNRTIHEKITESKAETSNLIDGVKLGFEDRLEKFKEEQNKDKQTLESEMKGYIENSIGKFMMVVKNSEDTTKNTFGFMQDTFE